MFFVLDTGQRVVEPTVRTGAIFKGFVPNDVLTKVVTFLVLGGVSVDVLVAAINAGVETMDGHVVAGADEGVERDTTDFMDPFIKVDIFEESKFRICFEIPAADAVVSPCFVSSLEDNDSDEDNALESSPNFSILTTGLDTALGSDLAGTILFLDLTDSMGLIFILTPRIGAEMFLTEAGTCFKLAFVGRGFTVLLVCLALDGAFGGGTALKGSAISSFLPSSELSAETEMFPKLLRFSGPWRDSENVQHLDN